MSELTVQIAEIVRGASRLMTDKDLKEKVEQKGNNSNYVTEADKAVQDFLAERLPALLSESEMLGEEGEHRKLHAENVWVVDPIDGTSNFIRDIGFSGISVGLVRNGKPYAGVIYNPYRDELYRAEMGKGAFLNDRPIRVSDRDFGHSHLCSAMCLYDKRYAEACFNVIRRVYMQSDDLRRMGTACLELAMLAAGRVELYFEMRLFPWDAAAAFPIIREAGGIVECLHYDGFPLDRPFPVIAANTRENFVKLKEIVCEEVPEVPYEERI
ncbi:MAG: inositol monophosphatase [Lachnospiraceae bacterium]|nr:inositol monophosphatase [Lachnospiraceae bacterium]